MDIADQIKTSSAAGLGFVELNALMAGLDQPLYRAAQTADWIHKKGAEGWDRMTNLPKPLRARLDELMPLRSGAVEQTLSAPDATKKILIRFADQNAVESVLLRDDDRLTACISTQIGCPMGCVFCASGAEGLVRNLDPGEIVSQVLFLRGLAGKGLDNIVVMGIGEPVLNIDNVFKALAIITEDWGMGLSPRRINVSTVGPRGGIQKLLDREPKVNLAVSLHAPDDETRNRIISAKKTDSVRELIRAAVNYKKFSGLDLTFEYVLIKDINDSQAQARSLALLLKGLESMVNLIPLNPIDNSRFRTPEMERIEKFQNVLRQAGINTLLRTRRGGDINAACGQLRLRSL